MSMKLSDIKGERVIDVIADIIDPVANIAEDDAAAALFRREKLPEGVTVKKFLTDRFRNSIPALLRGHKADIIAILAAICGVTPEEYSETLSIPKLMTDFIELMTDDCFSTLFISAQSGNPSGSAPVSTQEPRKRKPFFGILHRE